MMNRRYLPLIMLLAVVSITSGSLMSHATWIGKVGITFFHKGYNLLKIWWQGAIAVFLILMAVLWIHNLIQQKLPAITARLLHMLILVLVVTGLYLTYDDFHTDFSHRLLGHSFHYGFYLGWVGWIMICLFFIFGNKHPTTLKGQDKTETEGH